MRGRYTKAFRCLALICGAWAGAASAFDLQNPDNHVAAQVTGGGQPDELAESSDNPASVSLTRTETVDRVSHGEGQASYSVSGDVLHIAGHTAASGVPATSEHPSGLGGFGAARFHASQASGAEGTWYHIVGSVSREVDAPGPSPIFFQMSDNFTYYEARPPDFANGEASFDDYVQFFGTTSISANIQNTEPGPQSRSSEGSYDVTITMPEGVPDPAIAAIASALGMAILSKRRRPPLGS